jgi:indolepyruvate ferredoxin oxidoreductase alpha subunit
MRRTYDLKTMMRTTLARRSRPEEGPKVLIAQSECMLNKQRRETEAAQGDSGGRARGARALRRRRDTCTGDHSCIRLSGCPSLSIKPNPIRCAPTRWRP